MQIQFLGAARTVTGSKHLIITEDGKKILLDCGFFQGRGAETDAMNRTFHINPAEVDYLILSHAHIDHTGNIPNFVKQGFRGPIICTNATADLAKIMLSDSAHIQESDIRFLNSRRMKRGEAPLKPIYTLKDAEAVNPMFVKVSYLQKYQVCEGVTVQFTDSGHILGSAAVNLEIRGESGVKRLCFTGDIGRYHGSILKDPQPFPQADYIIAESTYGDRLHGDSAYNEQQLFNIVYDTCITRKGKLVIPAFSVGRTQEIVYALDRLEHKKMLPRINVYVDSPLSVNATGIMRAHPECFNKDILEYMKTDDNPFGFANLIYIQDVEDSKHLNDLPEPCIIISASGMAEAGRIKHHLANTISNPANTVLLVGYAEPRSLAGQLRAGKKIVTIFGTAHDVNATVEIMDAYSAHGDYKEMIRYLHCQDPAQVKQLFLVHGEYDVQQRYREKLMAEGFKNITIPEQDEIIRLD